MAGTDYLVIKKMIGEYMETYVFKVVYWDNGTKDKECYIEASSKTKAQKIFTVIYPDSNFKSATEIVIH